VVDKNGDSKTEISVYKDGVWYLDLKEDGLFDRSTLTISPSSIMVTGPIGGESWVQGFTYAITWTLTGDVGPYVKIGYRKQEK
jgi:hypothetical protein